jgi:hypothetical protein
VCDPERTQGLRAPAPKGKHVLVSLKGPGVFVAAQVTKQGGPSGITFVSLDLDGRNVTNLSFAAARNWGLTEHNPYGVATFGANEIHTLTVGFPVPLRFQSGLELSATVNEDDVVQILANVVHGSA